ncbi:hypothetical protein BJ508DRAFT_336841 [Ascobolus immersus RN42]|uniref:Uncharacterized protein n=1 Tax=Ascobolus immersus RN42 TaxID=1160509 RepID=A0A3N4H7A8_ASCIM|nr:hypothetical protein BJ508DRAFT_336841 [Ascobolus immersus RN42]
MPKRGGKRSARTLASQLEQEESHQVDSQDSQLSQQAEGWALRSSPPPQESQDATQKEDEEKEEDDEDDDDDDDSGTSETVTRITNTFAPSIDDKPPVDGGKELLENSQSHDIDLLTEVEEDPVLPVTRKSKTTGGKAMAHKKPLPQDPMSSSPTYAP